ncbi:hypothetical protein ASG04_05445 [Curtobacterium sp. Leaf183]|uniref:CG0192-related protein n=1 Tax=Curtobacterium sp. Leaf183 TaxID=1736291 RepID=UPI0006FA573B|nr:hypothetical protein [Curtobacterium sp. Leaf183]KQS10027.1 hypothetical protein ASG04_05445 [Curtobacterium sp. Leaf183]
MAVIHNAELRPSKTDAIAAWLPSQPWSGVDPDGERGALVALGRFRFDDPDGEVGVETYLVRVGDGPVLHVPLTYRGAPLAGAEDFLVTEMHHSVLGRRWVYDAVGDPVYADVLRRAIATGGHEAELEAAPGEGGTAPAKEGSATGSGSATDSPAVSAVQVVTAGTTSTVSTGNGDLVVLRVVGTDVPETPGPSDGATLTATWAGSEPTVVAVLRP